MYVRNRFKTLLLAGCAVCLGLALPGAAAETDAKPVNKQALEQRVNELEAALAGVRAELAAGRAQTVGGQAPADKPVPAADGFKVGKTIVKINGYIKAEALISDYSAGDTTTNPLGRDFYIPAATPVGGTPGKEDTEFDAHAKQTRLWLTTATALDGHTVTSHIEGDFQTSPGTQGTERTTNGYNFALRRAFATYDGFTFGQDWSTFANTAAAPESADYIGPSESSVVVRQWLARFSHKVNDTATFTIAVENPETATATPTNAALVENDDDGVPDLVTKLTLKPFMGGEIAVSSITRQLSVDTATSSAKTMGWGSSVSGRFPFGENGRHDVRFVLTGGRGIGRYVGINFAPDAMVVSGPNGMQLKKVGLVSGFAAVKLGWTDKLRSSFILSGLAVDNPDGFTPGTANHRSWSGSANLFYSPVPGMDLGIEYRHAERKLRNGQDGNMNRLHLVAKQAF